MKRSTTQQFHIRKEWLLFTGLLLASQSSVIWAQKPAIHNMTHAAKQPRYGHCVDLHKDDPRQCGSTPYSISGKGYSICEAYLKHLNSLDRTPYCEIPIPPNFGQPDWEELDVLQHLDWAYRIESTFVLPGGYHPPDFETWHKTFLEKLKVGKISPRMRKTHIKPLGEEYAAVLAYTRNRLACQQDIQDDFHEQKWAKGGYVLYEIPTDPTLPLREFGHPSKSYVLLLHAGKPYLFHVYDTTFAPNFYAQRIDEYFPITNSNTSARFGTTQQCNLELSNPPVINVNPVTKK